MLTLGSVPSGASYVGKLLHRFRRDVEAAVLERNGLLTLLDQAAINTALRWERHALLSQRWLCKHAETMNHDQRLAYSREIARASDHRDRALRELGLKPREDDLTALYSTAIPVDPTPDA
ncbi:MAG: hypothetical protein SH850_25825 [Planctomycetaceae bacterium]|nr:hypothetical protein [Planctomycetaceae bacterium]